VRIKFNKNLALLALIVSQLISHAQTYSDSLRLIWQNEDIIDSMRFNALGSYYDINNQQQPDSALLALDYHYQLAKVKGDTLQVYQACKNKGNIHRLKGNYNIAINAYKEAEKIALQLNRPVLKAKILGNIGNVFIYRKDYKQATQYFSKALNIYLEEKNTEGESHILTSLGSVYLIIQNYDLALEYYQKALLILNTKGGKERRKAIIYANIGWTNFEKGLYEDARSYYELSLKILQLKNEKFFILDCYSTLAKIHLKLNQLDQAKAYAELNLALNKELKIESGIIEAEIIVAQLAFETNIDQATELGQSILEHLPSDVNKEIKRDIYRLLYKCYKNQNELELALRMHEKFTVYRDSIQVEKNNFAVAREVVKNDYEIQLYEAELEKGREKAQLELSQLKRTFGIISVFVLLIALLLYYFFAKSKKNRIRRNMLLAEIESLKSNTGKELVVDSNQFQLVREKLDAAIEKKLNDTDWKVLGILLDDPVISNKEIAEKAFLSIDGIGSSLRRMYEYFDVKDSKYKKISLLLEAIKISGKPTSTA